MARRPRTRAERRRGMAQQPCHHWPEVGRLYLELCSDCKGELIDAMAPEFAARMAWRRVQGQSPERRREIARTAARARWPRES